jgi:hypothetical protein
MQRVNRPRPGSVPEQNTRCREKGAWDATLENPRESGEEDGDVGTLAVG